MNSVLSLADSLSRRRPARARARSRFGPVRRNRPYPSGSGWPPATFSFELEPVLSTRHYTVSKLRFPSLIETPDPENNTVHAEYFAPVGFRPRPARA